MTKPFPDSFTWGAATAAYQVEGAAAEHGKGPSVWDVFAAVPGRMKAGDGRTACDQYHRKHEDVALLRELGIRAYRFSVSWPRVLPEGRGSVNAAGLDYYDRLVDALLAAGIAPLITLYHWDLPAMLQMQLGGWESPELAHIFADYAELVFRRLGDRVKLWLTLNEPWVVVCAGYFEGVHPPAVRDKRRGYRAGHELLRAHAHAVARFRAVGPRDGQISFALNSSFSFPATDSPGDADAAERAVQNFAGWFAEPVYTGDYPALLRERLGDLLPRFSPEDAALLRGSTDFLALNYYTSEVVRARPGAGAMDFEVVPQPDVAHTEMNWPIRPDGLHQLLLWLHRRYGGPPIYITENGAALPDVVEPDGSILDAGRIDYLRRHISALRAAMDDGVDVRGYFLWSLLDNVEWTEGFSKRFGIVRCDFATQRRTIKSSGRWYADLIRRGGLEGEMTARPALQGARA